MLYIFIVMQYFYSKCVTSPGLHSARRMDAYISATISLSASSRSSVIPEAASTRYPASIISTVISISGASPHSADFAPLRTSFLVIFRAISQRSMASTSL